MKLIGSTLRIIIFSAIAVVSLLVLLFMQPVVTIEKYAEEEVERENARYLEQTGDKDNSENDSNWTTSTRGHNMAIAVAGALSPSGSLDEGKIPDPIINKDDK